MEAALLLEERLWKCRKHPTQRFPGVCPDCLSDRLVLLCPDCANLRPCGCLPSSSSSSSSSSSLSIFDPPRSSLTGRVGSLIDLEPAFHRSRSAVFQFPRNRSGQGERYNGGSRRRWRFLFWRSEKTKEEEGVVPQKVSRSRSVSERKVLGWKWHFPSPAIALPHRKTEKVVKESSSAHSAGFGS